MLCFSGVTFYLCFLGCLAVGKMRLLRGLFFSFCLFSLWKVIAMTGLLLLADAVDRRVVKAESGRCVACHAGTIRTSNLR